MAVHNYTVGLRNVGSYLVSGHPYITGSGAYASMDVMALAPEGGTPTPSGSASAYKTAGVGTGAKPAEVRVNFPYVSKRILVYASGSGTQLLRVHFDTLYPDSDDASGPTPGRIAEGHHFIELDADEDYWEFNVKTDKIYLSSPNTTTGFKLYAELTNIPTGSMYSLTGSGISD